MSSHAWFRSRRPNRFRPRLGLELLEGRELPSTTYHLDFGTASSPVAAGYAPVTPATAHQASRGYGWLSGSVQALDRGTGTDLLRAFNLTADAAFAADLAGGTYDVTVTTGDAAAARDLMGVFAEGVYLEALSTPANQFVARTYRVTVTDGQLTLGLRDLGGADPGAVISALDVVPAPSSEKQPRASEKSRLRAALAGGTANEGGTGTVAFTSVSGGSGGGYTFSFDFDNNGTFEVTDSPAPAATVPASFLADGPGSRVVRGRVKDGSGRSQDYTATVAIANVAPAAQAGGPYTGTAASAIAFTATATDPSPADAAAGFTYSWAFGDGGTSTQRTPSHTYAVAGTYTATLTVRDKDGATAAATATVTVNPAASAFIQTPHDRIPNFGANPTITAVRGGNWSDVTTWSAGRLPAAGDVVSIGAATDVTYDLVSDAAVKTVAVQPGGALRFRTDVSTRLTVVNLLVREGALLQIGTATAPVAAGVTAEVVFANQALDLVNDPDQYGNGLIALGKVVVHGAVKSDSFVRLAAEPRVGQTTLTLAQPVTGWRAGDRLVLPDSKHWAIESYAYVPEYEEATIASVSPDGRTLTLTAPLAFNHPGARNGDGVLEFLPHVGNRSRNVVFRSQSSAGTRGHTLFTHRADVDIRYAGFAGLGRTTIDEGSKEGRYPVHFHHLYGPQTTPANGYQFTFAGNAVFCAMPDHRFRWGVTLHDSHYGLIQNNFIYNWAGAGVVTEDGNESFNVIERNFVVRGIGTGDRAGSGRPGNEGSAFWFRGPNNSVRDNVAANYRGEQAEAAYGYKLYHVYLGTIDVPNFKGADTSVAGQRTARNGNALPLLEFARNEVYGTENGLSIWWLNAVDTDPQNGGTSTVKDFRGWHVSRYGFYGYPMADVVFDGYVIRGDKNVLSNRHEFLMGMWFGDYMTKNVVIRNADIQGMRTGIVDPYFSGYPSVIEDSYLRNSTNIAVRTPGAPGSGPNGAWRGPKSLTIRNVRFGSTAGWNLGGLTPSNISMDYDLHNGSANLVVSDTVFVYDYNGVVGDNFQVFYTEQAPTFVVPRSSGNLVGAPVAGLTNQQLWNQYQIAVAGAVATNTTTRAGVNGLVRALP
jgi:PKD repeat protein